jgi:hypothetical protein
MRSRNRSTGSDHGVPGGLAAILKATEEPQRGVLLDLIVFLVNLALMPRLTSWASQLVGRANEGDRLAVLAVGTWFLGMFTLPPAAAVLKRWHFHRRRREERAAARVDPLAEGPLGCLSSVYMMLFYFVQVTFTGAVATLAFVGLLFGDREDAAVFIPGAFLTLLAAIAHVVLVFRYFAPPTTPPTGEFLRSRRSEWLGDLCIFTNVMLFQVFWSLVVGALSPLPRERFSFFVVSLFVVGFLTLTVYLPPRIFYLAEDGRRPAAWFTMLLANLPAAVRLLFGTSSSALLTP